MSCQNKYSGMCEMNCQNKYGVMKGETKNCQKCDIEIESKCQHFLPFPTAMTAYQYAEKETKIFFDNAIPQELQGAFSHMAWEQGHSAGYDEVWIVLQDLVSEFAEAVKKYGERRFKEGEREAIKREW